MSGNSVIEIRKPPLFLWRLINTHLEVSLGLQQQPTTKIKNPHSVIDPRKLETYADTTTLGKVGWSKVDRKE